MKKSLLALAVLGAFASAASAQSSVTLSGSFDAGVRRVGTATGHDWSLAGQQSANNRFILSGTEDMGGGLRAFFWLEHRFRINNGTSNSPTNGAGAADCNTTDASTVANVPCVDPFWRRSYIGLSGAFGEVRLGRHDMPLQDVNGGFEPWGTGTVASVHAGGINATVRANNAIFYRSPSMGGLQVQAAIAAGEGQNQGVNGNGEVGGAISGAIMPRALMGATSERPIGFSVRYAAGPLNVAVAYDKNAGDVKTTGIYGAYNFGVVTLMGQFEKGDNATSVTGPINEDLKIMSIGLTAPFGPVTAKVGYVRVNSDLAARDGSKFGFGGVYDLSKRTSLYADVGKSTGDRFTPAAKKAAFDIGVTHRF